MPREARTRSTSPRTNSAERIERAAVLLFAKRGFVGTSIRDLAAEVGVSSANIYNHTHSKEDMLWKIISRTMDDLISIATSSTAVSNCPVAQLESFMRSHIIYHATHRGEARIGNTQWRHLSDERAQIVHAQRDDYTNTLVGIIARGVEEGFFTERQPKYLAFSLVAMGLGVSQWFRSSGEKSADEVADIYMSFVRNAVGLDNESHESGCPDPGHPQLT